MTSRIDTICGGEEFAKANTFDTTYLHALNLEFHVVFSGGFAIFPFLPTVSITSITHFLSRIEKHGTTFGSEKKQEV